MAYSYLKSTRLLILVLSFSTNFANAKVNDSIVFKIDSIFSKSDSIYLNVFPDDSITNAEIKSLNSIVIYSNYKSCIDCNRELVETFKKKKFKYYTIYVMIDENSSILSLRTTYNEWKQLFGNRNFQLLSPMNNTIVKKSNKNSPSIKVFSNSIECDIEYEELFDANGKVDFQIFTKIK